MIENNQFPERKKE